MSTAASDFRAAIERRDRDGMIATLADDVVLHSPVSFKPFEGKEAVAGLFEILLRTFEDFRYTDELAAAGAHALVFRASVGEREIEGIDLLRFDGEGLIAEFTVLLRPLSGLVPFAQAMAERVAAAGLEPTRS